MHRLDNLATVQTAGCANKTLDDIGKMYSFGRENGGQRVVDGKKMGGADKDSRMHNYLEYYEKLLAAVPRNSRILELGTKVGDSLYVWATHFCRGRVVGVDIDVSLWNKYHDHFPPLSKGLPLAPISVLESDATIPHLLEVIEGEVGVDQFDVIVDDASHVGEHIVKSFELLFPTYLKPGGIYIMEDVHMNLGYPVVNEYLETLNPYIWLCPENTTASQCRKAFGADKMAEWKDKDWRYTIESVTRHRDIIVITKKL